MGLHAEFACLSLDEQVGLVTSAWQQATLRLLIFDNCEEEALLHHWRPQRGGCRVLITSRRAHWSAQFALATLPLGLLSRTESMALLRQHCPLVQLRNEELVALAAELNDLPLALHLAGSYLACGVDALTPGQYLAELRRIWAVGVPAPVGHPSLRG